MTRRSVADVAATPHFDFLSGAFMLSKWRIPYFATTMSLSDAAEYLNLATEIPGAEEIQWKVDELFQRAIDWPRVERQILPYLRNIEVPQFFNSITVALVPYDAEAAELRQSFDESESWEPPDLTDVDRFAKTLDIGPVSFGFWEDWTSPSDRAFQTGQLRWNIKQLFGVTIDGQHRLAAVKLLASGGPETAGLRTSRLPVILLIFDPELGFSAPGDTDQVDLLRALFIDLNKHAQTVSRARQILLDDRDPHAVCVRRFVGNQLTEHLDELSSTPPRLPLSLVDWHSEKARFDTGPYLTTVLGLDWIVARVLDTRPIKDFTDYTAVRRQIDRLEKRLDVTLTSARTRVEDLANVKLMPFTYSDDELEVIAEAFADVWCGPLSEVLTRFAPYSGIIDHRSTDGTLSLDFQHWYELYDRQSDDPYEGHATQDYRRLLGRLANRQEDPLVESTLVPMLEALEGLKSGSLAFNVVFQRALVDGFLEYAKIGAEHVEELDVLEGDELDVDFDDEALTVEEEEGVTGVDFELGEEEGVSEQELGVDSGYKGTTAARAGEFVAAMNRLVERWPDFLSAGATFTDFREASQPFWLGTLLKPEGTIDFTQGASNRGKDLLFTVGALWLYADRTEAGSDSDFDELWSMCLDGEGPSVCRRIGRAIGRFSRTESSAGARILRARDEEHNEETARDEAYARMKHLWDVLGL